MRNPRTKRITLTGILLKQDSEITKDWLGTFDRPISPEELSAYVGRGTIDSLVKEKTRLRIYEAYATKLYLRTNAAGNPELCVDPLANEDVKLVGAIYMRYDIAEFRLSQDNFMSIFKYIKQVIKEDLYELNNWIAKKVNAVDIGETC